MEYWKGLSFNFPMFQYSIIPIQSTKLFKLHEAFRKCHIPEFSIYSILKASAGFAFEARNV